MNKINKSKFFLIIRLIKFINLIIINKLIFIDFSYIIWSILIGSTVCQEKLFLKKPYKQFGLNGVVYTFFDLLKTYRLISFSLICAFEKFGILHSQNVVP